MRTGTRPTTGAATVVLVLALAALAACGGGGGDDDSVASLDGSGTEDDTGNDSAGGGQGGLGELSPAFEDAMLEYAQCMRDQGVDFPDPQFDEGGGIVVGPRQGTGSGPPSEADMQEFEAADEECRHILEAVEDEMPRPDPEQEAEMRDEALAFAECMRDHGIDFPDPQFDGGGRVTLGLEGIDPEDPDFQAAQEECGSEGGIFSVGGGPAGGTNEDDG